MESKTKKGLRAAGRVLRALVNTIFFIALTLALLALIAAFAYQMVYHPDVLAEWANNLIQSVQGLLASFSGA